MATVAILGAGGHSRDIRAIIEDTHWSAIIEGTHWSGWALYDDAPTDDPMVNFGTGLAFVVDPDRPYLVAVNDPAVRRRLAKGRANAVTVVHRTVIGPSDLWVTTENVGAGSVIGAGTIIGPDVVLGQHVHVGAGCTITRTTVGAFTTIAPGVDIAGDVTIGEECLVGVGSVISNLVTIGDRCTIGAGAVVIHDVPDDTTVVGVPARPIR